MSFPRYPSYKDSGVEWLGEVPEHWEVSRLKYVVACLTTGGTPDTSTAEFWADDETGGVPWVSIGDMTREPVVQTTEKRLTAAGVAAKRLDVLPAGTLLYSMFASLGKVATLGVPAAINQAILGITPNDECVTNAFLKHWLAFLQSHIEQFSSSNTQDNLNAGKVRTFPVVVANTFEQATIATFLDRETAKIDALIAEQQRLIELLQEKRQAVISHAVTKGLNPDAPMKDSGIEWLGQVPAHWEVRRISSISTKITNGYVGPTRDILADSGVRYLQSLHIKNNRIAFNDSYFVSQEWSNAHAKSILQEGDVLIVQTGDIGQVAVVPKEYEGCNCHALIIVVPVRETIEGDWLGWVLNSEYGFHSLLAIRTGALHPHLNCGDVKDVWIPVPPLREQRDIVACVLERGGSMDSLITEAQAAITLLQERRSALISAAVTGQIDVRGLAQSEAA